MMGKIDAYFAMPETEQKIFQLARRLGMATRLEDVDAISQGQKREWLQLIHEIKDERSWNEQINELLQNFI